MAKAILIGRSDFSIGESILKLSDFVSTAAEKGHEVLALADTMTVSGMPEFTKLCGKHGIRPVIGCRIRVTEDASFRYGKARKPKEFYPMVWPKDQEGFKEPSGDAHHSNRWEPLLLRAATELQ